MKTALVLEGGALRTIYSSGVCDAFLDGGLPLPDYTLGVSAGIAYGVSYLSRQSRRNLQLACHYANDKRYMGFRNLADPRNRSYFGLKFAYETIPNELLPFDYDTFSAYPGRAEAVVTNLATGQAEYLPVPRRDSPNLLLEATCAIPLMFPVIRIGGQPYLDGGCADAIPWRRAFHEGCSRVVVVLTRERDYYKKPGRSDRAIARAFKRYPHFQETMRTRSERYNACREALFRLERQGKVLVIAPEDTLGCSRTEKDLGTIRALWQEGYFDGRREIGRVREFWSKE
ncbi:MAG: patatin family protein [Oscillibacter sp.]|jgi:predicted patatin/cPLA2 family phospholipase|nr:patatin family protein [Oscillibacter sp.]